MLAAPEGWCPFLRRILDPPLDTQTEKPRELIAQAGKGTGKVERHHKVIFECFLFNI